MSLTCSSRLLSWSIQAIWRASVLHSRLFSTEPGGGIVWNSHQNLAHVLANHIVFPADAWQDLLFESSSASLLQLQLVMKTCTLTLAFCKIWSFIGCFKLYSVAMKPWHQTCMITCMHASIKTIITQRLYCPMSCSYCSLNADLVKPWYVTIDNIEGNLHVFYYLTCQKRWPFYLTQVYIGHSWKHYSSQSFQK